MTQMTPITDEWLASIDFKWRQEERQPNKHWKLTLNVYEDGSRSLRQTSIEIQRCGWKGSGGEYIGDPGQWMVWITDTYERTSSLGNIQWQEDVISLAEIIMRRPWKPANHIYGQAWPDGARALDEVK